MTVYYTVRPESTATAGDDYQTLSGSVMLDQYEDSAYIEVVPVDDSLNESSETVSVALNGHSSYYLGDQTVAQLTIEDNDSIVTIAPTESQISENDLNTVIFTVSRAFGNTALPLTVNYSVEGDAVADEDCGALSGVLTIPAGETTGQIAVTPIDDDIFEPDETSIVTLSPGQYQIGASGSATVTLLDNEPVVTIRAEDATISEDATEPARFIVERSGNPAYDLIVSYTVWTYATAGTDYVQLTGTVKINANETSAPIELVVHEDDLAEYDESVQIWISSGADCRYRLGPTTDATITILDNEPVVTIEATDSEAAESGEDPGTFTVTRSGGDLNSSLTVTYSVYTYGSANDFDPLDGTVAFDPGDTTAEIHIVPHDDDIGDGDTTVTIQLSGYNQPYRLGTPNYDTVTIVDDEPVVWIQATDSEASEDGNDAVLTVTRSGDTSNELDVHYSLGSNPYGGGAENGVDYDSLSGVVTIPIGASFQTITITPLDDNLAESRESVQVTLRSESGYLADYSRRSATAWITDNEPTVTIAATDANAAEEGLQTGVFTVTRNGGNTQGDLNVQYSVTGATPGDDYVPMSGVATILEGFPSTTIEVTPVDDTESEPGEWIQVNLVQDNAYRLQDNTSASVIIVDNDTTVSVSATGDHLREDSTDAINATVFSFAPKGFKFSRNGGDLSESVTMTYTVGDTATADADYAALTGQVTLPVGVSNTTIYLNVIDDVFGEDIETVSVTLNPGNYSIDGSGTAELSIYDDEVLVSIDAIPDSVPEDGLQGGDFVFNRTGSTDFDVLVYFKVTGSATVDIDYTGFTGLVNNRGSITIPATANDASITITPLEDTAKEGNETITVSLEEGNYDQPLPGVESASITILDNETVVTIEATQPNASEDGVNGTFKVTRTGPTTIGLPVYYTVGGGLGGYATPGSDYSALDGYVTIQTGEDFAIIEVVPVDDDLAEYNESVYLSLSDGTGYHVDHLGRSATVTISDNEPTVTIEVTDATAAEGDVNDTGTFTVTRTGPTTGDLVVEYSINPLGYGDGSPATAGGDFAMLDGYVTIPDTQSSAIVAITPIDDNLVEDDETVRLRLSYSAYYWANTYSAPITTIIDDELEVSEVTEVTIEATDPDASEEGTATATFTVSRTGSTTNALDVFYAIGGTAVGDADFEGLDGIATISAGELETTIIVTPRQDILAEYSESVILTLRSNAGYSRGTPSSATAYIADNESTLSIQATDADAAEEGTDPGVFTITREGGDQAIPITVHYLVAGSATPGDDYTGVPAEKKGSVIIGANQPSATVVVTPVDDNEGEAAENVQLSLYRNTTYHIGSDSWASLPIRDNDPLVTITASQASANESSLSSQTFVVYRAGDTSAAVTINYTIIGDAVADVDYAALSGVLMIPVGAHIASIYLFPVDDRLVEPDETVEVSLDPGSYIVGTQDTAAITLLDDDFDALLTVAATDEEASEEGLDPGVFTIGRFGNTSAELEVSYSLAYGAISGTDYAAFPDVITFSEGEDTVLLTVEPVDDSVWESVEAVQLSLVAGEGYGIGSAASATVTITDNEPVVTIEASDGDASEENADPGEFTVTRTGPTTDALTVDYTVASFGATAGSDYVPLPGSVTIEVGKTWAKIPVTPIDDTQGETDEWVRVSLSSRSHYGVVYPNDTTVTIADNEPVVTVSVSDADASEYGPGEGEFTISRVGGDPLAALTVLLLAQGSATSGEDYVPLPLSVDIPANQPSIAVPLTPLADAELEQTEFVQLLPKTAGYRVGSPASAWIEIIDDYPYVSVSVTDGVASEEGLNAAEVTFTRTGSDLSSLLTVAYSVVGAANRGSDYTALTGTIDIPANLPSITLPITPIDDAEGELNESVVIAVSAGPYHIVPGSAAVSILDDESLVSILATQPLANEEGAIPATFTVTRSGGNQTGALVVNYSLSGTAEPGNYVASPQGSVTILANQPSATIAITPVDDAIADGTETVIATLAPGAYRLPYSWLPEYSAKATIFDNEPVVTIEATGAIATELNEVSGKFTVTRPAGNVAGPLTVNYTVSGTATSGGDYQALTGTVIIPATEESWDIDVTPIATGGGLEEDETVIVTLTDEDWYSLSTPSSQVATVTILDDKPIVSIQATDPDAAEDGTDPGQFTVSRTGSTADDLIVYYTPAGSYNNYNYPIADGDYTGLPGELVIPATFSSAVIDIAPADDILAESSEAVQIALSDGETYRVDSAAPSDSVTIADNEPRSIDRGHHSQSSRRRNRSRRLHDHPDGWRYNPAACRPFLDCRDRRPDRRPRRSVCPWRGLGGDSGWRRLHDDQCHSRG